VTGNLPSGFIVVSFTACGIMSDDERLSMCSLQCVRNSLPPAEISAPESGSISISHDPFSEVTWIWIFGEAALVVKCLMWGNNNWFSVSAQVMVLMPLSVVSVGDFD